MTSEGAPVISRLPESIWREEALARRFRIERELGTGGQAVVVVAYHRELDERVALKFLLPDVAQSNASVARFRREARAAAKIKNEHVVRIIDVCTTHTGVPYIVMEYLDGRDLEHVLHSTKNGQLAVPDAVDFVLQASEALAEGHRLGIVHRDLKPANLFCVDRDDGFPMIKVLDFGISKIQPLAGDVERTDRFEILGSPRYMSPEQIDASRDVDQRTDIWALGIILYQCLAGRVPFGGEVVADLWHKIRTDTPAPLTLLRKETPAALNQVVMRCLEKEPGRRFANLGEFADALSCVAPEHSRNSITRILRATGTRHSVLHSSSPTLSTDPTLVAGSLPPSTHARRRRSAVIGFGIGATTLAGLATAALMSRRTGVSLEQAQPLVTAQHPALAASTTTDKPNTDGRSNIVAPDGVPEGVRVQTTSTQRTGTNSAIAQGGTAGLLAGERQRTTAAGEGASPSSTVAAGGTSSEATIPPATTVSSNRDDTIPWIVPPIGSRKSRR